MTSIIYAGFSPVQVAYSFTTFAAAKDWPSRQGGKRRAPHPLTRLPRKSGGPRVTHPPLRHSRVPYPSPPQKRGPTRHPSTPPSFPRPLPVSPAKAGAHASPIHPSVIPASLTRLPRESRGPRVTHPPSVIPPSPYPSPPRKQGPTRHPSTPPSFPRPLPVSPAKAGGHASSAHRPLRHSHQSRNPHPGVTGPVLNCCLSHMSMKEYSSARGIRVNKAKSCGHSPPSYATPRFLTRKRLPGVSESRFVLATFPYPREAPVSLTIKLRGR